MSRCTRAEKRSRPNASISTARRVQKSCSKVEKGRYRKSVNDIYELELKMKKFITDGENLPAWSAPISHAVVSGDTCYLSGQLAIGVDGQYLPGTAREEAQRAFQNVGRVLAATGFTLQDMVFVDIAFIDLADLPEVNTLFAELFLEGTRPARTVYQAARLPYDARIKVSGIAVRAGRAPSATSPGCVKTLTQNQPTAAAIPKRAISS